MLRTADENLYIVDDGNYDLKGTYKLPKHEDLEGNSTCSGG